MIFKIHLGGNEAGKCLCHCDDAAQAVPHMHITNSLQARFHACCSLPTQPRSEALTASPPPWLQCLALWRHLFDKTDMVSSGARDKAQPGHGSWVLSVGIEVSGACLVMGLLFRCPGLHLYSLSDQPLDLCHSRFQTLKPQGFSAAVFWALLEELCQLS